MRTKLKLYDGEIIAFLIVVAAFCAGFYFYLRLPERVAFHWNATGEVDNYGSRFWGAFLMPIISLGLFLLFLVFPRIDPYKENIEKFRKYFSGFMVLILLFLFYLYALTIAWNLGIQFGMIKWLVPPFAVLFYYCGILIAKAEMNWTVGIRTPWTLSSKTAWEKTHKLGGVLFKISAVISLTGVFLTQYAIWLLLAPVIASTAVLFIYSYVIWEKGCC